ncbi:MAG: NYN domain-containing protein [Spirochaetales bacterium]
MQELILSEFRPGQSLGALVPASGRAVTGPKASLAHRWCARLLSDRRLLGSNAVSSRDEAHRTGDIHELRDDAARRLLASGIPEAIVAALFDPKRLASLLSERREFVRLVYWNRVSGTYTRYRFEDVNLEAAIVDGSNVAWNGGVRSRASRPAISNVEEVVSALYERYEFPEVDVLFDANILRDVSDAERIGELPCRVEYAPPGRPADSLILEQARRRDCLIISNDVFRDYRRRTPVRVRRHRVGVRVREASALFDACIDEVAALRHRPITS